MLHLQFALSLLQNCTTRMTNATIALIVVTLETNWIPTHLVTPMPGYHDTTVFYNQTAIVERVEFRIDTVRGKPVKREVDREFMLDLSTNTPPRLWPTNAPPSPLALPMQFIRHRQDAVPVAVPPLPPR